MDDLLSQIVHMPMPEYDAEIGSLDTFNPWSLFPALYGCYSSDFDECAIDVLRGVLHGNHWRNDLGAEMFREMLCTEEYCNYGTSPRVCFPTPEFKEVLPLLIDKWVEYSKMQWGNDG